MEKVKRPNPQWTNATAEANKTADQLYLYNSFTRQKERFTTADGKKLTWYSCGPTVYDESHMGHARCYMSADIMRRVIQDYFNYDVFYVMNITDIDDKIILRARQNYLYDQYVKDTTRTNEQLVKDLTQALELLETRVNKEEDEDKKHMLTTSLRKAKENLAKESANSEKLMADGKDVLSEWLDKQHGHQVADNAVFEGLPRHFENEFFKDMTALHILPPNVLTRVSEYVPEIVELTQRIIKNGFGYESNGSVYFDTIKYDREENHYYAKLKPESFGDSKALAEGEGALSAEQSEKRNATDFALWKRSKPGEPWWESPWGHGRPGWHIECSAMAGAVLGEHMDVHFGGVDLKFPHHDNELAQSEAAFGNDDWVNFFLHCGHLHIEGCKMSKSLKNFITIKQALEKYTARQLRILFLLHSWKDVLDYSQAGMDVAVNYEKTLKEFFYRVIDFSRGVNLNSHSAFKKWTEAETALNKTFQEKKSLVHKAMCDSINTPVVLKELANLITATNTYMSSNYTLERSFNLILLNDIAKYITKMMQAFGVVETSTSAIGFQASSVTTNGHAGGSNVEQIVMPYLNALAKFRDDIRLDAIANKQKNILSMCDALRDNVLPDLGVLLEDQSSRTVVKLCDRETLIRERELKLEMAERKRQEDLKRKQEAEQAKREKEAKKAIPPTKMFLHETDKYSKFDEKGMPVLDAEGKELSKSLQKKLEKLYQAQEKDHAEYLKSQQQA